MTGPCQTLALLHCLNHIVQTYHQDRLLRLATKCKGLKTNLCHWGSEHEEHNDLQAVMTLVMLASSLLPEHALDDDCP